MLHLEQCMSAAGLLLSCFNTWWMFQTYRVRLKLIPSLSLPNGPAYMTWGAKMLPIIESPLKERVQHFAMLSLRVINQSSFTIDIADIGFSRYKDLAFPRISLYAPLLGSGPEHFRVLDNGALHFPAKLQSRESVLAVDDKSRTKTLEAIKKGHYRWAYVATSCGTTCFENITPLLSFLNL